MAEATATPPQTSLKNYELMFVVDSSKYASDPDGTLSHVTQLVENVGGNVDAQRPWKEGKLEYEMDGHKKGLHFLVMCRMPGSAVKDLDRAVKLDDVVVRHLVIQHPAVLFDAMVAALGAGDASESEDSADAEKANSEESKDE